MPSPGISKHTLVPASGNSSTSPVNAGLGVDHDRQRLVVDDDELGGVLALVALLGHDDGDRLADEADDVVGEERAGHRGREHEEVERHRRGEVEVGGGEHAHARPERPAASEVSMPTMRAWAIDRPHVGDVRRPLERAGRRCTCRRW